MQEEIDIFDQLGETNFAEVETTMPLLQSGAHVFTIRNMERQQWKSGAGSSIVISLNLAEEAADITGERICGVGYPVTDRISLVQKGRYNPKENIARFLEALGMTDQPFDTTFQAYINMTVKAITKIVPEQQAPDGTVYPPKVEISKYLPL